MGNAIAVTTDVLEGIDDLRDVLGEEGLREVIELFLSEAGRRLETLGAAVARRDSAGVVNEAHALKGSSGSLGARQVSALCGRLETAAKGGCVDGGVFDTLVDAVDRASSALACSARLAQPS